VIAVDTALIEALNQEWIDEIEAILDKAWARCLSNNLAVAGALCATHMTGWDARSDVECFRNKMISWETYQARIWHPGCGRPHR